MQHVSQVVDQVVSTTTEPIGDSQPSDEAKAKAKAFFSRMVLAYGEGRTNTLWRSEEQFRLMRREWVDRISALSWEELETAFDRLKDRLEAGDPDYRWPDIAAVLRLARESNSTKACHRVHQALPEPEWRRQEKREAGKRSISELMNMMGRKCTPTDT